MSLVHTSSPYEFVVSHLAILRDRAASRVEGSRFGLFLGLGAAALAGTATPLREIALAGPVIATVAAGAMGGRSAAAVGFVAYLAMDRPSAGAAILAGAIACLVGWGVPLLIEQKGRASDALAIVVDCDGFGALDETYGEGSSNHAFDLLHRAMRMESQDNDLVVHIQDRELVLVVDGTNPRAAQELMARVERRFAVWLSDAGYECELTVGLSDSGVFGLLRRTARRCQSGPYLD